MDKLGLPHQQVRLPRTWCQILITIFFHKTINKIGTVLLKEKKKKTAAGSEVKLANVRGWESDIVKGGEPSARIAVYEVCWLNTSSCADVLKAFDDAIHDGVDITMSLAETKLPFPPYLNDCFSVGALESFRNGILVSSSAGNLGYHGTVANSAPWFLTVAASSTDRESFCQLSLGHGSFFVKGHEYNLYNLDGEYELVSAYFAGLPGVSNDQAGYCYRDTLDPSLLSLKERLWYVQ
ncbi:hypothetical protein F2P56_005822 [Juglans regia]|uniref:Peptidase S8/S53 domain-containing protein n=1 Tax=Juglans regia TaxID=51240 RepID=A0A834D2X0_JUGRE|nr:hypothetical protein F2P56_005822 [Juglans regia]